MCEFSVPELNGCDFNCSGTFSSGTEQERRDARYLRRVAHIIMRDEP
jgi:hypothetical protein